MPVNSTNPPPEFKQGKFMVFIGGGNGSGKTVISNLLFEELAQEGYDRKYIAEFGSSIFDDILSNRLLQSTRIAIENYLHSAASSTDSHPPGFLKQLALKAFTNARTKAMDVGAPVIVDYHMHDKEFVKDCIADARKHGYECIMLTPHVDAENIFSRLKKRFEATGRPFKLEKILERHRQFADNLDDYFKIFDLSIVLDNNKENAPPTIVAISHSGETTVFNQRGYENVRHKSQLNPTATCASEIWQEYAGQSSEDRYQPHASAVGESHADNQPSGTKADVNLGRFARRIEEGIRSRFGELG